MAVVGPFLPRPHLRLRTCVLTAGKSINSPYCKRHGHLHRCLAKGHFLHCEKHGYHSRFRGCFHCTREERDEVRRSRYVAQAGKEGFKEASTKKPKSARKVRTKKHKGSRK